MEGSSPRVVVTYCKHAQDERQVFDIISKPERAEIMQYSHSISFVLQPPETIVYKRAPGAADFFYSLPWILFFTSYIKAYGDKEKTNCIDPLKTAADRPPIINNPFMEE